MEDRTRYTADPAGALKEISLELHFLAGALADLALPADEEHASAPFTARRVAALLAARARRTAAFPLSVTDANWTLLLELFHAYLQHRPLRPATGADREALRRLAALGLATENRGAWSLAPEAAHVLHHHLDEERRALTGR